MRQQQYEVVPAKTADEALAKCMFKVGQPAKVVEVRAVANSNGTYSCFPIIQPAVFLPMKG